MLTQGISSSTKTTISKNTNEMKYNASNRFAEARLVRELTQARGSVLPSGFNGGLLIESVIDFAKRFPQMKFIEPKYLAEAIIIDARTLPSIPIINNMIGEFYLTKLTPNLNNIYVNAPAFFEKNFINDPMGFELYQKYYYLICFIKFVADKLTDAQFQANYKMTEINAWVNSRRDPNIDYIIVGPTENTVFDINFEEHYSALISSSTSMADIVRYQQLTTAQTTSDDILNILTFLQRNPNTYYKNPDEAKKYTLNIDSSRDVIISIDKDNNLLFDCGYVNFGDTTESNDAGRIDEIHNMNPVADMDSRIATKKIERIFQMYSRVKVLECVISPDAFITSLDIFPKVFIVFQGVLCSERNIYNTIENNYFKIGGCFKRTNRGYEFQQDVNAITYKTAKTRVSGFKIFISLDPNARNVIMPNEYPLKFTKFNVYQHPYTVNEGVNMKRLHMVRVPNDAAGLITTHQVEKALFNPARATTAEQRKYNIDHPKPSNVSTESAITHDIAYIDTDTGMINGKYFRFGTMGEVLFKDELGSLFEKPDKNWIKYNVDRNDICLINLLKYDGKIKHIPFGSYLYSEYLRTIQNLNHTTDAWNLSNLNFRYDTTYTALYGNTQVSIIPEYEGEQPQPDNIITWEQLREKALVGEMTNREYYKVVAGGVTKFFAIDRDRNKIESLPATTLVTANGITEVIDLWFLPNNNIPPTVEYDIVEPKNMINQGPAVPGAPPAAPVQQPVTTVQLYRLSDINPDMKKFNIKPYYKYYQLADYYMYNTTKWTIKITTSNGSSNITVKDSVGNTALCTKSVTENNISVSNSSFEEISGLTLITYTYFDSSNNKVTLLYCRFTIPDENSDYYIIVNSTFDVALNETFYEVTVIDINTLDILFTNSNDKAQTVFNTISTSVFDDKGHVINKATRDLELINLTPVITNVIGVDVDGNNVLETTLDTNYMTKFRGYTDDYDQTLSNAYKAYIVGTFDPTSIYWTDSMYTNSVMRCHLPIVHPYYDIPFKTLTVDGTEDGTIVYKINNDGSLTVLPKSYTISPEGLFEVTPTSTKKLRSSESIYVSRKWIDTYYYTPLDGDDLVIPTDGATPKQFSIRSDDLTLKFIIIVKADAVGINDVTLFETNQLIDETKEISNEAIYIGSYKGGVRNNIPLYIEGYEIVINTIRDVDYQIQNISLSKNVNETHEYRIIDNKTVMRWIDTFIYSNRCERILERDLFRLSIPETVYAIHPFIRYLENSFVLPKRVNEKGEYITIVNKTNQNITTGTINMYNNYETTKSNTGTDLRIGNRIGPQEEYIIESMDAKMLLIGNMFKQGSISEIAIRKDDIYVVPKASKMNLTLEFT